MKRQARPLAPGRRAVERHVGPLGGEAPCLERRHRRRRTDTSARRRSARCVGERNRRERPPFVGFARPASALRGVERCGVIVATPARRRDDDAARRRRCSANRPSGHSSRFRPGRACRQNACPAQLLEVGQTAQIDVRVTLTSNAGGRTHRGAERADPVTRTARRRRRTSRPRPRPRRRFGVQCSDP